ncbi:DUF6528 family protein [Streptomyces spiramyceticus]|uniref:DUF6528 family protein n=1 Tax=Streptomyces spiramyceticus TaxID=299717 RepID=UPI00237AF80A|nr:DUF6528 family protein [Streptomyces spiramyceticus]
MDRRTLLRGAVAGAVGAAAVPATAQAAAHATAQAAPANYRVALTDQKTNRFLVFERNQSWTDANLKWSFDPGGASGWNDPFEIRFRQTQRYGTIALMTAGVPGNGRAGIVRVTGNGSRLTRSDLLWETSVSSYPHSVERVPGAGAVVVAGTRDRLHVYGVSSSNVGTLKLVQTITDMPKPHAVLWDDENKLLWVTGGKVIRTYRVSGSMRDVRLRKSGADIAISGNGHDIQPDYANPGKLTVTDSHHVYAVDKRARTATSFSGADYVKSYVRHPSGEAMWTLDPTPADAPYGGPTVHFSGGATKTRAGAQIYKARIVTTRFQ